MGLGNQSRSKNNFKAPDKGVFCISANKREIDKSHFQFSDSPSESLFLIVTSSDSSNSKRYIYYESERVDQSIAPLIKTDASGFSTIHFTVDLNNNLTDSISDIFYNVSLLKQYFKYIFLVVDQSESDQLHIFSKASKCTILYDQKEGTTEGIKKYLKLHTISYFYLNNVKDANVEMVAKKINKKVHTATQDSTVAIAQVSITTVIMAVLIFFSQFMPAFDRTLQSFSEVKNAPKEYIYQHEFNGNEKVYRIARYLVSRHVSWLADSADIMQYLKETIDRSTIYTDSILNYKPRENTVVNFYPVSDSLKIPPKDSLSEAYDFFTTIYSDSIAYLTDYWQKNKTRSHRKHKGIDVGTSFDTYIFAPINGHAHVRESKRGGKLITLYNEDFLITFAHCNKLLFFDNQDAYIGDVLATVGVSGNTSGPHAHIETGIRHSKGKIRYGKKRYKLIDPFEWYPRYQKKQEENQIKKALQDLRLDSIRIDSLHTDSVVKDSIARDTRKKKVNKRKAGKREAPFNREKRRKPNFGRQR